MRGLLPFFLSCALLSAQTPRIGILDFYGLRKVSEARARKALGVKEGDPLPHSKGEVEERLEKLPGVVSAHLAAVCCERGDAILFVGIEEKGAAHFDYREPPQGDARLPDEIVETYREFLRAVQRAVREGNTAEDLTSGHSLMADPTARRLQERFAVIAELNLPLIKKVLRESADEEHRAVAAWVIGYAPRKHDVIDDLQLAIQDPDESVRNNAVRALAAIAVLAARDRERDIRISPTWFVQMLNSLVWTDRNKAAMALLNLTEDRPENVLALIRERALASLSEMARWRSLAHAIGPYTLLGRVAGLSEKEIQETWEKGQREAVIKKALKPPRRD